MTSLSIRLHTALDRSKPAGERFFAAAELVCLPLSWATFAWMLADLALNRFGMSVFPADGVWARILTAAAIGYITNWLAIQMLFRPYERHEWLFVWKQGLLPRNKAKMAAELGHTVGDRLLSPDKIVAEFSDKASAFLSRPDVIARFRDGARELLLRHSGSIAEFLVPQIERAADDLLDRFLAPDNLRAFWDETLAPRLADEATREFIASKIIELVHRNAPELAKTIQSELRDHLRNSLGRSLVGQLGGGTLIDLVVDIVMAFFADETIIRRKMADWLRKPETAGLLKEKLLLFGEKTGEWLRGSEGRAAVGGFAAELKGKAGAALSAYVRENLPGLLAQAIDSPGLWTWVETSAIPELRARLGEYLEANKAAIAASLDLSGRVEAAVNAQSIPEFHAMLDRLAARHLGAIQVLGYALGALVGAIQALQSL